MVPLNSWPIVMGRVSLVTGWGVTGEKLEAWVSGMYVIEELWKHTWARRSTRVGLRFVSTLRYTQFI